MTERPDARLIARRFAWLCDELVAGNAFSPAQLGKWRDEAWRVIEQIDRVQDEEHSWGKTARPTEIDDGMGGTYRPGVIISVD